METAPIEHPTQGSQRMKYMQLVDQINNLIESDQLRIGDRLPSLKQFEKELGMSRSEEHTSELQSLMRMAYPALCLNKQTQSTIPENKTQKYEHPANTIEH